MWREPDRLTQWTRNNPLLYHNVPEEYVNCLLIQDNASLTQRNPVWTWPNQGWWLISVSRLWEKQVCQTCNLGTTSWTYVSRSGQQEAIPTGEWRPVRLDMACVLNHRRDKDISHMIGPLVSYKSWLFNWLRWCLIFLSKFLSNSLQQESLNHVLCKLVILVLFL